MKIKSNYRVNNVAGRWIVISVADGVTSFNNLFELNESALLMWRLLENGCEHKELVVAVINEYDDADNDEVEADVSSFVSDLNEMGMIENYS